MSSKSQSKKKVAFLFGAGAEGTGNYNLKSGLGFMKSSLNPENKDAILFSIEKVFKTDRNSPFIPYKNAIDGELLIRRALFMRSLQDITFLNKHYSDLRAFFNDDDIKALTKEHPNMIIKEKSDVCWKNEIIEDFNKTIRDYSNKSYETKCSIIKDLFDESDYDKFNPYYNISLGPILDAHFHSIINPRRYSRVYYSRVFNYYWFCYFSIIEDILKNNKNVELKEFYKQTDKGIELDYIKILENTERFTQLLYQIQFGLKNTYYQKIKQYINEHIDEYELVGCITTNYYNYAERDLIGQNSDDLESVAHLNGKLSLFEFPEINYAMNICENRKPIPKSVFFPFIFGQSTVKPIVHPLQIKEYAKCSKILDESDVLIILGYGINEDDNHVNSYISDFLRNDKKVYLANPYIQKESVRKALRVDESCENNLFFISLDASSNPNVNKNNVKTIFDEIAGE